MIASLVEGNDIQTITVNCFQFLVASCLQTLAECQDPYPEIKSQISKDEICINWMFSRVYRQFVIAMVLLLSNYVKHLVYSGLFIEKEKMKRQKIQLNRYFNNQRNGIAVFRDGC